MLYIFMVDLAQYSAADSKTQHQAFTGTSHQVSANEQFPEMWLVSSGKTSDSSQLGAKASS